MSCDGDIGDPVPQYGTCVFECDPGYESLGSRFDLCLNGRWINGAPTCQRKWSMESFFGAGTSNSAFVLDLIMGYQSKAHQTVSLVLRREHDLFSQRFKSILLIVYELTVLCIFFL